MAFAPLFGLLPFLRHIDQSGNGLISRMERRITALIDAYQNRKIPPRSHPDIRRIHRVIAAMIESFPTRPTALSHNPAKRIIAAERRSLKRLIRLLLQQC